MSNTKKNINLIPCPFCGGEAKLECTYSDMRYWVDCKGDKDCGASNYFKYHTKAEAITLWNKRAEQSLKGE